MLDLNLDILSICTPPGVHARAAIIGLNSGCNVLVEKPMAMNIKEANEMISAHKKSDAKLCVVHNFLFSQSMLKVQRMLKDDEIGSIQDISAIQMSSTKRELPVWYPALPGKLFFDEIPHMIYTIRQFIPDLDIKDIRKVSLAKNYPGDNIYVDFSSENIICSLKMIFNAPCSEWKIMVIGSKRVIIIDLFRDSVITMSEEKSHSPTSVLFSSANSISQSIYNDLNSGVRLLTNNLLFGHDILIQKFINSIEKNIEPPISPEEGAQVVKISEYITNKLYKNGIPTDNKFYNLRI